MRKQKMGIPKQLKNLKLCRIKKGEKKPFEKQWTNKPYTYEEISKFFPEENYGVLCGYENLAVIDSDDDNLQLLLDNVLPDTFKIKTGGGGVHNYYFIPGLKHKIILELDSKHLGEVQSYGTQVVGCGSLHPSGKNYEKLNDNEIKEISLEELYSAINPYIKKVKESQEMSKLESEMDSEIDNLSVADIWGTIGLKKHGNEYYGSHPIHDSEGGMNFWINPLKNTWHCFRCDSGGGVLSAIGVKEGIISCSEAQKGTLRGSKALECIKIAKEKYGLKNDKAKEPEKLDQDDELPLISEEYIRNYEEKETGWLVDKILKPASINILAGKRSTFKSWIALNLSYCISKSLDFLDKFPCRKTNVCYIDRENGILLLKPRLNMIRKGLDIKEKCNIDFLSEEYIKIDKEKDVKRLENSIIKNKIGFLIVDTYRRVISFDENDAGEVSRLFVDLLKPLCEKTGVSILLIHHEKKGESPDKMDMLRGSSDLANYVDSIIQLTRRGDIITFKQTKNRSGRELEPFSIKVETDEVNHFTLNYLGIKETVDIKIQQKIIEWIMRTNLTEFQFNEAKKYCESLDYKKNSIVEALKGLVNKGLLEKDPTNYRSPYYVSPELKTTNTVSLEYYGENNE